jgi:hypothetical protein
MRRILFSIVSSISFLLLIAFSTLWIRSHFYADVWSHTDAQGRTQILQSQIGAVHFRQIENNAAILGMPTIPIWTHNTVAPGTTWNSPYTSLTSKIEWRAAGFAVVSGHTSPLTPFVLTGATPTGTVTLNNTNTTITNLTPAVTGSLNVNGNLRPLTATTPPPAGVIVNPQGGLTITGSGSTVSGITASNGTISMNPGASITANTITFYNASPQTHLAVIIPYWCPTAIAGILPLVFAFKSRKWLRERRRKREGLCRCCGYDLRASTERCPECGTGIEGSSR